MARSQERKAHTENSVWRNRRQYAVRLWQIPLARAKGSSNEMENILNPEERAPR
jgi:hypothetical protein